jgi:uncharacterized protein (TIGR02147 family)
MVSVFNSTDYRTFISKRFLEMPKRGYGQARKLSNYLGVHTTLVSQILKGLKTLTLEQASLCAEFLGLTDLETEYFLLLVQWDRAGNESLRKNLKRQMEQTKSKSIELVNRLKSDKKLKEEQKAIFYSDWVYSAVRQLTAIGEYHSVTSIAEALDLSPKRAREVVEFLLSTDLIEEEKGKLKIGAKSTHLESTSPWIKMHHMNWRQKSLEEMSKDYSNDKLFYTAPMTLSKKDALKIREMIVQFLEKVDEVVEPSPSEELWCIGIDWFRV